MANERADYLVNDRSPRYLHGFQRDVNDPGELPHTVPENNQVTYIDSFTNYGVDTIYGKEFVIAASSGRADASSITNTPAGNIAATTVQAAIDELDSEKGGLAQGNTWAGSNTFTQSLTALQFVKSGGTSGQFLKADGSVDSSSYEATITTGTTSQYYRGDKTWQALDTAAVTESTNLYFTNARVLGTVLTGLNTSLAGAVVASDTILAAIGKLENRVAGFSASCVASFNTRTGAVTLTSGDVTGALGFSPSPDTHTHTFASLTSKPTTLSGYGITDAASSTHNHDGVYAKLSGATFSGNISAPSTTIGGIIHISDNDIEERGTNAESGLAFNYSGYNGGTTQFRNFNVYDGKNGLVLNITGSSKAATFAGSVSASSLIKTGGASNQFLKADGSVTTATYAEQLSAFQDANSALPKDRLAYGFISTTGAVNFPIETGLGIAVDRYAFTSKSCIGSFRLWTKNTSENALYFKKITAYSTAPTWSTWEKILTDGNFVAGTHYMVAVANTTIDSSGIAISDGTTHERFARLALTRSFTTGSRQYISMVKSATYPWGIGMNASGTLIFGQANEGVDSEFAVNKLELTTAGALNVVGNLSTDKQIEAKGNGTSGGIVLRDPSGARYRLSINSSGELQLDAV